MDTTCNDYEKGFNIYLRFLKNETLKKEYKMKEFNEYKDYYEFQTELMEDSKENIIYRLWFAMKRIETAQLKIKELKKRDSNTNDELKYNLNKIEIAYLKNQLEMVQGVINQLCDAINKQAENKVKLAKCENCENNKTCEEIYKNNGILKVNPIICEAFKPLLPIMDLTKQ